VIDVSPTLSTVISLNNYSQNLAIVIFAASGLAAWLISRRRVNSARVKGVAASRGRFAKAALLSLFWMFISGVPRMLFYRRLEWAHAVGSGEVVSLIVKQALTLAIAAMGACVWTRLNKMAGGSEELSRPA
jgi:hypothetical protein